MTGGKTVPLRRLAGSFVYVVAWPAFLLALGGDVRWVEAWLFAGWLVGLYVTITAWTYFNDPALLAERRRGLSKEPSRAERQDRALVFLLFVGFVAWIVLMPLDARRFGWTLPFSPATRAIGAALLLLSSFFLFRSFHDNTFLSGLTRVQAERKQRVVSVGVYGFVRHPMYLGIVLMFTGAPLLLGSRLGLAVSAAVVVLLAVRIMREERLLATDLDGYEEYRQRVRYRLVPLIW